MNIGNLKAYLAGRELVDAGDEKVGIVEYGKTTIPGVPGVGMTDAKDSAACEAGAAAPAAVLSDARVSSKDKKTQARKYLGMVGDELTVRKDLIGRPCVATKDAGLDLQGAALKGWKNPVNPSDPFRKGKIRSVRQVYPTGYPFKEDTVEQHDKRWHGGKYDGGTCTWRTERGMETWAKGGKSGGEKADSGVGEKDVSKKADVTWDGKLDDMTDNEIYKVVDDFFDSYGDDIYGAIGDDGVYVRKSKSMSSDTGNDSVREYDPRSILNQDVVKEAISDALPNTVDGINSMDVVSKVAKELTKMLDDMPSDELGHGREAY